ncbi:NCA2 family protein [Aspergillus homomorphus CBS 101889]|uniref:NCA2-domain-containing protein n=1 Tax=Aspergillus homomorphus (strain CBS 101889) TaxID=1450537 RepID=A0A395I1P6_ASPHC|nr:NCA2-domain-containing protein [Aspergillus homomorphus CBS 101889]RAL13609.1 NCA2-domain-containing protein [Aspergillus homomorphus CBS 101889]
MFVVNDKICNLDIQLHNLQQRITKCSEIKSPETHNDASRFSLALKDIETLERICDSLSVASRSQPILRASQIARLTSQFPQTQAIYDKNSSVSHSVLSNVPEISWIVAARAAIQTYGTILESLSENALVLGDEVTYWAGLLESPWYMAMYTLQISPVRLWHKLRSRFSVWSSPGVRTQPSHVSLAWAQLYDSARRCASSMTISTIRKGLMHPLLSSRLQVQQKQKALCVAKDANTSALGILMERCFQFELDDELPGCCSYGSLSDEWCSRLLKSVALMRLVLQHLTAGGTLYDFELRTIMATEEEDLSLQLYSDGTICPKRPEYVIEKLNFINQTLIPEYIAVTKRNMGELGRPPLIVRYWLPFLIAILSTSTTLEMFQNRRRELLTWVTDIGSTTIEFWYNWVVDPLKRLVGTIRHNEDSEIALMSKNSLQADRASLERMVVDFVLDHREPSDDSLASREINAIMNKVREGDLTPVLKAYEKDLRTPFIGTVRGDLVRALLIQIQKTKVDVEVAIGGIDSLLKSQELVFGFVGLTPGLLVSYASIRWLYGLFGSRKGLRIGRRQHELRHALRQVHRDLTLSTVTASGTLSFKDYGQLICNTEILLQKAQVMLTGADIHAFQEDINDMVSKNSAKQQLKVVERMGWVYSRWL